MSRAAGRRLATAGQRLATGPDEGPHDDREFSTTTARLCGLQQSA